MTPQRGEPPLDAMIWAAFLFRKAGHVQGRADEKSMEDYLRLAAQITRFIETSASKLSARVQI